MTITGLCRESSIRCPLTRIWLEYYSIDACSTLWELTLPTQTHHERFTISIGVPELNDFALLNAMALATILMAMIWIAVSRPSLAVVLFFFSFSYIA